VVHIYDMPGIIAAVPGWIPPSQVFWIWATTIGFFLAAIAFLTGLMAPLASRLLTVEIVSFELFFWIPRAWGSPHTHFVWSGNAISTAIAGAIWVVSDSFCRAKNSPAPQKVARTQPG